MRTCAFLVMPAYDSHSGDGIVLRTLCCIVYAPLMHLLRLRCAHACGNVASPAPPLRLDHCALCAVSRVADAWFNTTHAHPVARAVRHHFRGRQIHADARGCRSARRRTCAPRPSRGPALRTCVFLVMPAYDSHSGDGIVLRTLCCIVYAPVVHLLRLRCAHACGNVASPAPPLRLDHCALCAVSRVADAWFNTTHAHPVARAVRHHFRGRQIHADAHDCRSARRRARFQLRLRAVPGTPSRASRCHAVCAILSCVPADVCMCRHVVCVRDTTVSSSLRSCTRVHASVCPALALRPPPCPASSSLSRCLFASLVGSNGCACVSLSFARVAFPWCRLARSRGGPTQPRPLVHRRVLTVLLRVHLLAPVRGSHTRGRHV